MAFVAVTVVFSQGLGPALALGDPRVESEPAVVQSWEFVAPNEHANHVFEACIEEGDVYVAVGSFRALNVAAAGKVRSLVLLDHDEGMQIFNAVNLQLIARASSRFRYLSLLMAGEPLPALEEQGRSGALSLSAFLAALATHPTPVPRDEAWRRLGIALPAQAWAQLASGPLVAAQLSLVLRAPLREEFGRFATLGWSDRTIWGSDERFARIQAMVQAGEVTVITGSLTGKRTVRSLAQVLRAQGRTVAALDLSDVPTFVQEDRKQVAALLSNIQALPFAKGGQLLLTARDEASTLPLRQLEPWSYYALPFTQLHVLHELLSSRSRSVEKSFDKRITALPRFVIDPSNAPHAPLLKTLPASPCASHARSASLPPARKSL